ncbi:MAG TPA: tyrosine-type recombinase/integrase [Streptosporangiaceae bacterium]|nr:tyrosine-type recombinase/integrase [Streptosporangiaceae bacterium]
MDVLHGVRMAGPLEPYARGLAGELARLGFTELSARAQLGLAAHLSRWLAAAGLGTGALTSSAVEEYLAARRAAGYTAYLTPKAVAPLLGYLRGLGVAPLAGIRAPATPAEELLEEYRCYLLAERGVQAAVARGYLDSVRSFVACHAAAGADLRQLTAGDVTAFLVGESRRLAPKTAQRLATALRSLLRFWHLQGLTSGPLDQAVPKIANRRPGLPRPLEPRQVQALLASCDRGTADGRRDLAMLTLLARLGLRAGEVAGLRLDDIDWRLGEITIAGKGNRRDKLPLPADAGEAMAGYLRHGRPSTALDRGVFIRIKAPHRGLTSGGVTQAVAAAARRAGLGTVYAHRLRHSAATAILAEGGSLAEVGQVLRHRRLHTTAAYTKVSVEALRALARPWPGVS